jgi:hypothetical protein
MERPRLAMELGLIAARLPRHIVEELEELGGVSEVGIAQNFEGGIK